MGFGVLCSLRWWRFREGARSVGPGLGARLQLGPAGDVAPLFSHSDVFPVLDRPMTFKAMGRSRGRSPALRHRALPNHCRALTPHAVGEIDYSSGHQPTAIGHCLTTVGHSPPIP